MITLEQLLPILIAIGSGAWFGLFWWITQYFDPTKETVKFRLPVLLVTIAYAAVIGLYFYMSGVEVTMENICDYFAKNLVMVIFIQRGAQTVFRYFFNGSGDVEI